jgi:hypothetical protein
MESVKISSTASGGAKCFFDEEKVMLDQRKNVSLGIQIIQIL